MKRTLTFLLLALTIPNYVLSQRYLLEFENEKSSDLLEKAERAYANKRYVRSTKLYDQLINLEGENFKLVYNQLTALIHTDDSTKLESSFNKLNELGFLDCNFLASTQDFKEIKYRKKFQLWQLAVKNCSASEINYIEREKIQNPELRKQLLWMKMNDIISDVKVIHKIRYGAHPDLNYDQLKVERMKIYVNNFGQLQSFIALHGWPGKSLVGKDGAEAAWMIAQHANHIPTGQKEIIPLLKKSVDEGEAEMSHYAHLYDRVQANFKKPQRYGTLRWKNPETQIWGIYTLEDSSKVNVYRAEAGLPPIEIIDN